MSDRKRRIENALWGLFAGDALAMPAHWFYSPENLKKQFDGGLTGYADAPHPHPDSFMVGMSYKPDVEKAEKLNRPYDILHEHARFYETTYSDLGIESTEREGEHGNATPALEDRYHYHHGLKAGENTVAAHLVRVLMRSVVKQGRYDEAHFLDSFVEFLTTPRTHRDAYREIYIRSWFENFSQGAPLHACAERQREVWSIGSLGGMIRPMVLSMLATTDYQGLGFAVEHQNLTHRSENVAAALGITVPLLQDCIAGRDAFDAAHKRSLSLRVPKLNGKELHEQYRSHKGPGNISPRRMWELHTQLSDGPFDLGELARNRNEEDVILNRFATACYPEHGLPLLLFLGARHDFDPETSLLVNANAGGDNVHRGAVLGLLAGAANAEFPDHLKNGLTESETLAKEIGAFAELAAQGGAF